MTAKDFGFAISVYRAADSGFWPTEAMDQTRPLGACELQVLLMGGDPAQTKAAPAWRQLPMAA